VRMMLASGGVKPHLPFLGCVVPAPHPLFSVKATGTPV
jgi:hypothetical protein